MEDKFEGQEPEEQPEGEQEEVEETEEVDEEAAEEEAPAPKTVPITSYMAEKTKRQELEAKLREQEELAAQSAPKKDPQTWEDHYDANPKGTIDWINGEIARLAAEEDPQNAVIIEQYRDKKLELREYGNRRQVEKQSNFANAVHQAVPDYSSKQKALTDFAVTELGYTMADLGTLTNPAFVGERAALQTIKLINKQYDASKASTTVKKKVAIEEPTEVERPGKGIPPVKQSLQKLWEKGQSTGDYAEYYKARGII